MRALRAETDDDTEDDYDDIEDDEATMGEGSMAIETEDETEDDTEDYSGDDTNGDDDDLVTIVPKPNDRSRVVQDD